MNRIITVVQSLVVLLAALSPPAAFAARPNPHPDQPGALTAEEIRAATGAMMPFAGGEAGFRLVASGLRAGAGSAKFALFAMPFARHSDRAETQQRILCGNVGGPWICDGPVVTARVTRDSIAQEFEWHFAKIDVQTAVAIVDFLYSPCFATRYAAIGGKPFTPSPQTDYIESAVVDGKGFGIYTGPAGGWVFYQLQRTDKPADNCSFDIHHVKTAKSGVVLPASYASEVKARDQQEREMQQAARDRRPRSNEERVVEVAMPGSIVVALLALTLPWLSLLISQRAAAGVAGILTIAATVLFAIAEHYYRPGADIRLDLVIIPPLLLLAWLVFIGLSIWQLRKQ
jgi:hypothetical protein